MSVVNILWNILILLISINSADYAQAQEPKSTVKPRTTTPAKAIPALPLTVNGDFEPLKNHYNPQLQQALQNEINKNKRWTRLIANKKMAVGVVDLKDQDNPRFARINGDEMMYAASLPKIAVLLATVDAIDKNEIESTPEIQSDMRQMISKSNNQATTRLIDQLGYHKIESVLTDEKYHLYEENNGGGLWVGKRYASGGPTNREPLKNLSHAASAYQVCRFYYMMVNGKLVSPERSKQMLSIMEAPEINHKFVNTLNRIAPVARKFRKSGSWKSYHSDSILVWGKDRRYILVALVDDEQGEQIMRNLVLPVERALAKK